MIAGWGASAAALVSMICVFVYIVSGDEFWSDAAQYLSILSGANFFFSWLGWVKVHS